jgi:hypothetical protein
MNTPRLLPVAADAEASPSRDVLRSRRPRDVRAKTIPMRELVVKKHRLALVEPYPEDVVRPVTRGDCRGGPRPCPWVSCAHHLYLEVTDNGGVKLLFPDLEPEEMAVSCALDVADEGGETLEAVGAAMNITRERVRQMQERALDEFYRSEVDMGLELEPSDDVEHEPRW